MKSSVQLNVSRSIVLAIALWSVAASAYAAPLLLPLGDSITQGWPPEKYPAAYRGPLQEIIGTGAYDFVGPFQSGEGDMDPDHAGVGGEETPAIYARLQTYMDGEMAHAPEGSVVLIHAGTNDVLNGNSVESALQHIRSMVQLIAQKNPSVHIYLATIVPINSGANTTAQQLNAGIRDYVARANLPQLHLVDHYAAFVANAQWQTALLEEDTVHPNAAGLRVMARTWAQALRQGTTANAATHATASQAATTAQQTTTTNTSNSAATQGTVLVQENCAVPFDAAVIRNPLLVPARGMSWSCARGITFTLGTAQTYTYKTAYVTLDGEHFTQKFDLTGTTDASGQWIIGPAKGVVPNSAANQDNFVAVYSCQKVGTTFRCGCTADGRCSDPLRNHFQWYVQQFEPDF